MKKASSNIFMLAYKGLSNDGVGATRSTVYQGIRPGAGFKNRCFRCMKSRGGYRSKTQENGVLGGFEPRTGFALCSRYTTIATELWSKRSLTCS